VDNRKLNEVLRDARAALTRPENDFAWSSWPDAESALVEVDEVMRRLSAGQAVNERRLVMLFAPTGPIQEVSVSSGATSS
jgi:hypothetical protein